MQTNDYPLVTIGIPAYNRENTIKQTLQSAVEQNYPNLEIIISDNASTDGTDEICKSVSAQHSNVFYTRQAINRGATENFKTVLKMAKGSYFMWLGDDDWLDKNYITECVKVLSENSDMAIVGGQVKYYGINDNYLYTGIIMNLLSDCKKQRVRDYFSRVKHNGIFYGVIRRDLIIDSELENVMGGDLLLVASLVFRGKGQTLETCCLHRRRGGMSSDSKSMTKSMRGSWLDYYFPRVSVARNVFQHILLDPIFNQLSLSSKFLLAVQCISYAAMRKTLSVLFKKKFIEQSGQPD